MRFSLVISVLGLSLAVTATPVAQSQPDQSVITCKNNLNDMFRDLSELEEATLSTSTHEDFVKLKKLEDAVQKNTKDTSGECLKVAHVSNKEAAEFEDVMMKVLGKVEILQSISGMTPKIAEDFITIYRHFYAIYPKDYRESLLRPEEMFFSKVKFPRLCDSYSFCINRLK